MPCLQKNGAVTPQYRQHLCPAAQGRFFHAVFAQLAEQLSPKTTGRWFESARMKTQISCKQKTASVSLHWRSFYGRGWITQAALLETAPLGCFCPFFCDGAAAVRIHPHENQNFLQTENRQRISTLAVFLWARVDYASRASKKAPQGLFSPPDCSAGRCCSNPPA